MGFRPKRKDLTAKSSRCSLDSVSVFRGGHDMFLKGLASDFTWALNSHGVCVFLNRVLWPGGNFTAGRFGTVQFVARLIWKLDVGWCSFGQARFMPSIAGHLCV